MYKKCSLKPEQLRRIVDISKFKFKSTKEIDPLKKVIGQERAVSAINFALEMQESGYNVFVTGSYGTGRTTIVTDLLNEKASNKSVPHDWAFVFNFKNPDEPLCLEIPSGQANNFKKDMQRLINNVMNDIQKAFESKSYLVRKNEIIESYDQKKQDLYNSLDDEARKMNIQIKSSNMGFITVPLADGKAMESNEFQNLPNTEQEKITKNVNSIQKRIQEVVREVTQIDRVVQDKVEKLNEEAARFIVDNHFAPLIEKYGKCKDIKNYLDNAAEDIILNINDYFASDQETNTGQTYDELPYKLNKYKINVVIDNSQKEGAPVIYETNPTYRNLFGHIEKKAYQGFTYTDYTMIKAGSILKANGGYLMLDAEQLLRQPFSYEALKRALRSKTLRIEDYSEILGYTGVTALKPAAIPLDIKVVLIGHPSHYRWLHNYDEEFRKIFKVRADFDTEVKYSPATVKKYYQFISRVVHEEELLHFNQSAIGAVVEYGYRIADHKNRLSIRFGEIVKIIREASFWAKKKRKKIVSAENVYHAIEMHIARHDLIEEKIQDSIIENTINVDVKGFIVGQVNGLAVYDLGDYAFGKPSRITVNTFIGSRGIINIEREAKLSGRIHDKGLLVLSGYFSQKFGTSMPLAFAATITFEQSYGMIDGDSASSTELYGLLSSLSGVPVNQGIAVTGSVNQKGQVQAIGGVNEKIEGFYRVCKIKGLTGDQGVIIPKSNVQNLMLNAEVVKAVESGKFTIWAVDHIEDGIRILTGVSCGLKHKDGSYTEDSIFEKVRLRLVDFARTAKTFNKNILNDKKDQHKTEDED
jgi:lon-related putative ATP-dependent protease